MDEQAPHDSSAILEILTQTIEDVTGSHHQMFPDSFPRNQIKSTHNMIEDFTGWFFRDHEGNLNDYVPIKHSSGPGLPHLWWGWQTTTNLSAAQRAWMRDTNDFQFKVGDFLFLEGYWMAIPHKYEPQINRKSLGWCWVVRVLIKIRLTIPWGRRRINMSWHSSIYWYARADSKTAGFCSLRKSHTHCRIGALGQMRQNVFAISYVFFQDPFLIMAFGKCPFSMEPNFQLRSSMGE